MNELPLVALKRETATGTANTSLSAPLRMLDVNSSSAVGRTGKRGWIAHASFYCQTCGGLVETSTEELTEPRATWMGVPCQGTCGATYTVEVSQDDVVWPTF